MRKTFYFLLFLSIALFASAQEPLLTPQQMPNPIHFLPPPPDTASAAFAYDQAQYHWGKQQRQDSLRAAIAFCDANWRIEYICQIFSQPFGIELYRRTRPFVYYGESSLVPEDEEELRNNGSYPSGHTIEGWSAALLLSELNPERADTILARGYMYGQSRVIAGYHWQSDVDAGYMAASAGIARLHADKRFQRLLKKAKREYACKSRRR